MNDRENQKRKELFTLLSEFIGYKIDTQFFVDSLYYMYGKGDFKLELSEDEDKVFSSLQRVTRRFSPIEEDIKNYPDVYKDSSEVRLAAEDACKKLKIG